MPSHGALSKSGKVRSITPKNRVREALRVQELTTVSHIINASF